MISSSVLERGEIISSGCFKKHFLGSFVEKILILFSEDTKEIL